MSAPLLRVENLRVEYRVGGGFLRPARPLVAVRDISFTLEAGESLGVVGETGCGKSSLGKALLGLAPVTAGRVVFDGTELNSLAPVKMREFRRDLQIVFQDPLSSLNPRMTVGDIVGEPLRVHRPELTSAARRDAVAAMLERVGLSADMDTRYPAEFSGGQCQRISIARAMILEPRLIVCDEPVSALDVSIQAQICNLLRDLQRETGVALLFISHDLSVVRYMCRRILVMYLGRCMELAGRTTLFTAPRHPYSRALMDAIPRATAAGQGPRPLAGDLPSPLAPPPGCSFHGRCPEARTACAGSVPGEEDAGGGDRVACHRWRELPPGRSGAA